MLQQEKRRPLDGADVVYVARFPSRPVVSADLAIGTRLPAWCTGPGRAILPRLDAAAVQRLIPADAPERRTPRTAPRRAEVLRRIVRAARDGYAVNDQESFVCDISVAAPVLDRVGSPSGR
jgi:IclR family pca regulon transcriptional regulator